MNRATSLVSTALLLTLVTTSACTDDANDESVSGETSSGDGDGDASTGDGDGDSDPGDGDGDSPTGCEPPPTTGTALATWLASGEYQSWPAESAIHDSAGPHFGGVRTFINPCLDESLAGGAAEHPVEAAAVKELYGDGEEVRGHAVMVKVASGAGADGWYWYEDYDGQEFADGVGVGLCTGCHSGGLDFVLSPYPLQ